MTLPRDDALVYQISEALTDQITALRQHGQAQLDALKALMEARFGERDRLMDDRFTERDLAVRVASEEREKAAAALRSALERAIAEGDERLREHVANQIAQVRDALHSANALEEARVASVRQEINAIVEQLTLVHESSERAIAKAEAANERRFESVNEFRQEAREVRSQQAAALAKLVSELLPREVFETTVEQWSTWRTAVDADRAALRGRGEQKEESRASTANIGTIIGSIAGMLAIMSIVVGLLVATRRPAVVQPSQDPVITIPDVTPSGP